MLVQVCDALEVAEPGSRVDGPFAVAFVTVAIKKIAVEIEKLVIIPILHLTQRKTPALNPDTPPLGIPHGKMAKSEIPMTFHFQNTAGQSQLIERIL